MGNLIAVALSKWGQEPNMSKANQAFNNSDEAVSPVIGVILMVAITVVLAAVVFVLVSNLGEGSESAPNISFNKDSAEGTLTVVQAEDAEWGDFSVTGCDSLDSDGDGSAVESTASTNTDKVDAGDFLSDCDGTVRITHRGTNSLVYETTFTA